MSIRVSGNLPIPQPPSRWEGGKTKRFGVFLHTFSVQKHSKFLFLLSRLGHSAVRPQGRWPGVGFLIPDGRYVKSA